MNAHKPGAVLLLAGAADMGIENPKITPFPLSDSG
jgi:hypothetical protein